jgi:hypothetical protein
MLFTKPTDSTRERVGERETGGIEREAEAERVRARAFARFSQYLVSVPAATPSARNGDEREFIGRLLSADGCARAQTHTLCAHSAHTLRTLCAHTHR